MIFTQRIFWPQIADTGRRDRVLAFLARNRALCHEVSFFTEGDGTDWRWLPPEEIARRAALLGETVRMARALGFAVAVNVLNTMGHSDEGGPDAPLPAWRRMVGHDGRESRVTPCPQDPAFHSYVRLKYGAFAATGATRYWIDDDVRLRNHSPVQRGCFCPSCCALLARRLGLPAERAERVALAALVEHDPAGRAAWDAHEHDLLGAVLDHAVAGIIAVQPDAEIGLMTCEARDHRDWIARLGRGGGRPWIRPGGGFWNDEEPRAGLLRKLLSVGAQCDGLPVATGVTYEVENYPYAVGAKSAAMTGFECLLAVLSGRLDGIMFDVLDGAGNDPAAHAPWFARLAEWAPLLTTAAKAVAGTTARGWLVAGGNQRQADHQALALQRAGLPFASGRDHALGWIAHGWALERMPAEEVAALFDRPVLLDGEAVERCLALGLGERIGITATSRHGEGVHEVFTDHPLNGNDAGTIRGFTLVYFGLTSHALAAAPGTAVLSRLRGTRGADLQAGPDRGPALTLHTPAGQPPVAALGHGPWHHVLSPPRVRQLGRLSAALLGETLRVRVDGGASVVWWQRHGSGRDVTVLANPGFDPLTVGCSHASVATPDIAFTMPGVDVMGIDEGMVEVTLPPWSAVVLSWSLDPHQTVPPPP